MRSYNWMVCILLALTACEDPDLLNDRKFAIAMIGGDGTPLLAGTYDDEGRTLRLASSTRASLARNLETRGIAPDAVSLLTPHGEIGLFLGDDEVTLDARVMVGDEMELIADRPLGVLRVMPKDWGSGSANAVTARLYAPACVVILEPPCIWLGGTGPTVPESEITP